MYLKAQTERLSLFLSKPPYAGASSNPNMGDFDTLPSTSANLHHHKKALIGDYTNIQRAIAHSGYNLNVTSYLLEIELLLLSLTIGIQHTISFSDFYCFASNQTGNTVLFAVGVLLNRSSSNNKNGE